MNVHNTLPKQNEIEEFLGREFFPKYPYSLPLKEAVDMVQIEFNVSDEARALPLEKGHGSEGTVLECLTYFAIMRLKERGFVSRTGENEFKQTGKKYFSAHVSQQDVAAALVSVKILLRDKPFEVAFNLLGDRWPEDVLLAAQEKLTLRG